MAESIPVKSLWEHLKGIRDPRSRRGRQYRLAGLLGMLILGALHGEGSLRGMWLWGCHHWREIVRPLELLGNPHAPVYNTVWYVVRALQAEHLRVLEEWLAAESAARGEAISVDGKVQGGSRRLHPPEHPLDVVTAVGQELRLVLGQEAVSAGGEVAATIALLKRQPLQGRVVVADAGLLCRAVVQTIQDGAGDYLGVVKGNQPELKEALETWVEPQVSPPGPREASG